MCASCFTAVDAVAMQATGGLALSASVIRWVRDGTPLHTDRRRRLLRWATTAELLEELGHDPVTIIGECPSTAPS